MSAPLQLPVRLEGAELAGLKAALVERRGAPLALDGAQVERINGLGLELLIAAMHAWRRDGQPLEFAAASPALAETFQRLGLPGLPEQAVQ